MRARQACVSSTEEIFLAASAAESSVTVEFSKLLDDLGNEVQAVFDRRSDGPIQLALVAFGNLIRTQPLDDVEGMRHGFYASGVDRLDLADEFQDPVQALADLPGFAGLESDPGEAGEAADLVVGKRHSGAMRGEWKAAPREAFFPSIQALR